MNQYHSINGRLVSAASAVIGVQDLSVLRGYGVFDFFEVRSGVPIFLPDYLDRFFRSSAHLRLTLPVDRHQLIDAINEVILANGPGDYGVRLEATGGYSADGFIPADPNWMILRAPLPKPTPEQYRKGITLMLFAHQRELPEVKSINYLTGIYILPQLMETQAQAVLYHDNGWIRESDRSNFFLVSQTGSLQTPSDKILDGITRKKVLTLAREFVETEEKDLRLEDLTTAREAFITSTTKGVLPVTRINDRQIGDGVPGPVTRELDRQFRELTRSYIQQTMQV